MAENEKRRPVRDGASGGGTALDAAQGTPAGYAFAADDYYALEYAPLPLLDGGKGTTPKGATGYSAPETSDQKVARWIKRYGDRGVCIRAEGWVGIDVDAYVGEDGKPKGGARSLAKLEREHGPLPPTVRVTSRAGADDYDGVSGIRLYRLPPSLLALERKAVWKDGPGEGIDTIRLAHRQVNVWPTRHPKTGRQYGYLDERTGSPEPIYGLLPHRLSLPMLPDAWAAALLSPGLTGDEPDAVSAVRTQVPPEWLTEGEPCKTVAANLKDALAALDGDGRHGKVLPATTRLLRDGEQGHHGAAAALDQLQEAFVAAIQDRATEAEAEAEWQRQYEGAVGKIHADGLTVTGRGCCTAEDDFGVVEDDHADAPDDAAAIKKRLLGLGRGHRSRYYSLHEVAALPPRRWLVEGTIPEDSYGYLIGRDGTYKTFLAVDLALSVATGTPWQGRATQQGRVAVYVGEGGMAAAYARVAAWCQHHGVDVSDVEDRVLLHDGCINLFKGGADFDEALVQLDAFKPHLVVIDTLARAVSGADQNDNSDMSVVTERLDMLKRLSSSVLTLAHTDKADNDARGASAIEDNADFVLHSRKAAGARQVKVTCTKMRDGASGWHVEARGTSVSVVVAGESVGTLVMADPVATVPDTTTVKGIVLDELAKAEGTEYLTTAKLGVAVNQVRKAKGQGAVRENSLRQRLRELREDGQVVNYGTDKTASWGLA